MYLVLALNIGFIKKAHISMLVHLLAEIQDGINKQNV